MVPEELHATHWHQYSSSPNTFSTCCLETLMRTSMAGSPGGQEGWVARVLVVPSLTQFLPPRCLGVFGSEGEWTLKATLSLEGTLREPQGMLHLYLPKAIHYTLLPKACLPAAAEMSLKGLAVVSETTVQRSLGLQRLAFNDPRQKEWGR